MAPLSFKMKALKSTPFSSISTEEELTKAWRVCTSAKEAIENGSRLENLAWRLWFAQKAYKEGKLKSAELNALTDHASTLEINLGQKAPESLEEVKEDLKSSCCSVESESPEPSYTPPIRSTTSSLLETLQSSNPLTTQQISSFFQESMGHDGNAALCSSLLPHIDLHRQSQNNQDNDAAPASKSSKQNAHQPSANNSSLPNWIDESIFFKTNHQDPASWPMNRRSLSPINSDCTKVSTRPIAFPQSPQDGSASYASSDSCTEGIQTTPVESDNQIPEDSPSSKTKAPTKSTSAFSQSGVNQCANCATTTTPLWRRSSRDEVLCNACGL
jgi:hypothetical protein